MKRIDLYLRGDQVLFLNWLPGSVSEHVRHAIDKYIKSYRKISKSPSKGGVENGTSI